MKIRRYYRVGYEKDVTRGHPMGLVIAEGLPDGKIALGFCRCSENDVFDTAKANLIAEGRLASRKFVISRIEDIFDTQFSDDRINNGAFKQGIVDQAFSEMRSIFEWCVTEVLERPRSKVAKGN